LLLAVNQENRKKKFDSQYLQPSTHQLAASTILSLFFVLGVLVEAVTHRVSALHVPALD